MRDKIVRFLMETRTGNKSDKAIRKLIADHFGGTIVGRYVKIGNEEFYIRRDADDPSLCGLEVRLMDWGIGNDWRFSRQY